MLISISQIISFPKTAIKRFFVFKLYLINILYDYIIIKTVYIRKVERSSKNKQKKDKPKTLYHGHYSNDMKEGSKNEDKG